MRSCAKAADDWAHASFALEPTGRGPLGRLRLQRADIRRERDYVFRGKFFDDLLHQRAGACGATARLEFIELAHDVGRRASGDLGNRADALQCRSVTDATG